MRWIKLTSIVVLLIFVGIQFIRPKRNISSAEQPGSIEHVVTVPPKLQALLKIACYDCHSNNTHYPWYMNVQPAAWFMAKHVEEGKAALNFDDFSSYSKRRQGSKLKSIVNSVREGTMPIASYKWMHKEARLSDEARSIIINWAMQQQDSLFKRN